MNASSGFAEKLNLKYARWDIKNGERGAGVIFRAEERRRTFKGRY